MKKKNTLYPSTQLLMLLHPKVLKVFMYLLAFQNTEIIMIYPRQLSKSTKLTEKDVEISVQSLIDNNLIQVKHCDGYEVTFNEAEIKKYFKIPIKEAIGMELLPVSTEVTWNKQNSSTLETIEELSEEQIKLLLLRLQASLNEKQQIKKVVVTSNEKDDLPF